MSGINAGRVATLLYSLCAFYLLLRRRHQLLLELLDLFKDSAATRTTLCVAALDARLKVKDSVHVVAKVRRDRLELLERELRERDAGLFRQADARARNVVRLAEGDLP